MLKKGGKETVFKIVMSATIRWHSQLSQFFRRKQTKTRVKPKVKNEFVDKMWQVFN